MQKIIDITSAVNHAYREAEKREDRQTAILAIAFIVLGAVLGVGIVLSLPGWLGF